MQSPTGCPRYIREIFETLYLFFVAPDAHIPPLPDPPKTKPPHLDGSNVDIFKQFHWELKFLCEPLKNKTLQI